MTEITYAEVKRACTAFEAAAGYPEHQMAMRHAMYLAQITAEPLLARLAALESCLAATERRPVSSYRPLSWGVQVGKPGAQKPRFALGWGVCS